ncbi:MAG: CHAD domain-containing protein [Solirubrobacterales bacterium]|nr:CHAD domain-containing protein [Solirubrobacterales bacterium]
MPSSSKSEVERKFLVDRDLPGLPGPGGIPIEQGYLAIDEQSEVRLRRAGKYLTLTVKNGHGETRQEVEVEIGPKAFDDLWPETAGRRIRKVRRKVDLASGLVAELDIYSGNLDGTSVVEVEFESEEQALGFRPPVWFGRELTGDQAWANRSLAVAGKPGKRFEFRLRPGEEPVSGICRVIAARVSQAAVEVRKAGEADDPAGHVHEARKNLKKARSALRLLRGVITDDERQRMNSICQNASSHLSGARDAEVKLATLVEVLGERRAPDAAGPWRESLETEAKGHREDLTAEALNEVADSLETVGRAFRGRELPGNPELVAGNAGRGYRRGRKAMKSARRDENPELFHDWRKRAKDLRYQLEILETRLPDEFAEVRADAEKLADWLGDLHDFDVLADDLAEREMEASERAVLTGLISDARESQVGDCLDLGEVTYPVKPRRFTNQLAEYLR